MPEETTIEMPEKHILVFLEKGKNKKG